MLIPSALCYFLTVTIDGVRHDCPGAPWKTTQGKLESYFREKPYGNGNCVVHAKPLASTAGIPGRFRSSTHSYESGLWFKGNTVYISDIFGTWTWYEQITFHPNYIDIQVYWWYPKDERQNWYAMSGIGFYYNGRQQRKQATGMSSTSRDYWFALVRAAITAEYAWTGKRITDEAIMKSIALNIEQAGIDSLHRELLFSGSHPTSPRNMADFESVAFEGPSNLSHGFLFDEPALLLDGESSCIPYAAYHLKAMRQGAYLDALDHIPILNDNSIANIIELVGFIKALVIDHRIDIPNSLSSLWLSYRYQYGTGKLDAEEAISFVHRYMDVGDLSRGISCYGRYTYYYKDVEIVARCRIDVRKKELAYVDEIWTGLYKYGLTPSFYVIWDMIPYSFIVDWFIPVGDILNGFDKTRMYDRTYDISNIWYSVKYSFADDLGNKIQSYTRWGEETSPEFSGYYTLENKGTPSNKTIGYRILDTLAIVFK